MQLNDGERIEELITLLHFVPTPMYADHELNTAINYAVFLENHQREILQTGEFSASDILYGEYYWFTKFLVRYEKLFGKNGSMRQKQFKILEEMDRVDVVDSALLEKIEQDLGYFD